MRHDLNPIEMWWNDLRELFTADIQRIYSSGAEAGLQKNCQKNFLKFASQHEHLFEAIVAEGLDQLLNPRVHSLFPPGL